MGAIMSLFSRETSGRLTFGDDLNHDETDVADDINDSAIYDGHLVIDVNDLSRTYTCPLCMQNISIASLSAHFLQHTISQFSPCCRQN